MPPPFADESTGLAQALARQVVDENALVFAVRNPQAVERETAKFLRGDAVEGGLGAILEYARTHEGASVTPLFGEEVETRGEKNWRLALPDTPSGGEALSEIHHVRLSAPEDYAALEAKLQGDPDFRYVHRPAVFYPLVTPRKTVTIQDDPLWCLAKCGFRSVWKEMEREPDPGRIGIIDLGRDFSHPELAGLVDYVPPGDGMGAASSHALSIAGVIAAIRGGDDDTMVGCCSAKLRVFNAWGEEAFDSCAFYCALKRAAKDRLPVVNLSLGAPTSETTTDTLLRKCLDNGVVVVAAMGDLQEQGSPPLYPAANCNVIAVGATDAFDRHIPGSSTGSHIWICAPGESIRTLQGSSGFTIEGGTSYSTAIVSAAVWLVKRAKPELDPAEIRELLAKSAAGSGKHTNELGHGRLDMVKLAALVRPKKWWALGSWFR